MSCPFSGKAQARHSHCDDRRYGDYLTLDNILSCQKPLSDVPEEMLFIIQHQTTELWMKLMLHELCLANNLVRNERVCELRRTFHRIHRIIEHMIHAWTVLDTLSLVDFLKMRPFLGSASGDQSLQFREIEFLLGNKDVNALVEHSACASLHQKLADPSIYDTIVAMLGKRGFNISTARINSVSNEPTQHDDSVESAWLEIYRNTDKFPDLYDLAEDLIEFEDRFKHWRFHHICTVERVIGYRQGTAGTSGVGYLREKSKVILFPELWSIRTKL
ncbi:TPA: tryptophan 2,3-dioxygenase [Pseudomonas aeruginosa]|nr:tryptophan 2,3-dioxygenase [Pseudomonas aeruginosa]